MIKEGFTPNGRFNVTVEDKTATVGFYFGENKQHFYDVKCKANEESILLAKQQLVEYAQNNTFDSKVRKTIKFNENYIYENKPFELLVEFIDGCVKLFDRVSTIEEAKEQFDKYEADGIVLAEVRSWKWDDLEENFSVVWSTDENFKLDESEDITIKHHKSVSTLDEEDVDNTEEADIQAETTDKKEDVKTEKIKENDEIDENLKIDLEEQILRPRFHENKNIVKEDSSTSLKDYAMRVIYDISDDLDNVVSNLKEVEKTFRSLGIHYVDIAPYFTNYISGFADLEDTKNNVNCAELLNRLNEEDEDLYESVLNETREYSKKDMLRLMHDTIMAMNNENAYYGSWISAGVPDGADDYDFESIAEDDEDYKYITSLFNKIYKRYHKDSLYNADEEVIKFAHKIDNKLGLEPIKNILPRNIGESFKVVDSKGKKVLQGGGFTSKEEAEMFAAQYGENNLRVVRESFEEDKENDDIDEIIKINSGIKNESIDFVKKYLSSLKVNNTLRLLKNDEKAPKGFSFKSGTGREGEVNYNGIDYAWAIIPKTKELKVMKSSDAGSNWSETIFKESSSDTQYGVLRTGGSVAERDTIVKAYKTKEEAKEEAKKYRKNYSRGGGYYGIKYSVVPLTKYYKQLYNFKE